MILHSVVVATPKGNVILRTWVNKEVQEVAYVKTHEGLVCFQNSQPPGHSKSPDALRAVTANAFYLQGSSVKVHANERCYLNEGGVLVREIDGCEKLLSIDDASLVAFLQETPKKEAAGFLKRLLGKG